jgi:adenylate kinase
MRTHIVLLGPPGAGKGTQGQFISKNLNIPFISSGDALREELGNNTDIGSKFRKYINAGLLVPDEIVEEFIGKLLDRYDLNDGFIFDGFPRTVHQADFIIEYLKKKNLSIDVVIYLSIKDEEIIKRISGRRICPNCGAVYNIYFNPPKFDNKCDLCGVELIYREDDKEEVVRERINVYKKETHPLINYFKEKGLLEEVEASGTVKEVQNRIQEVLHG